MCGLLSVLLSHLFLQLIVVFLNRFNVVVLGREFFLHDEQGALEERLRFLVAPRLAQLRSGRESVVFRVAADPYPLNAVGRVNAEGAILPSHPH